MSAESIATLLSPAADLQAVAGTLHGRRVLFRADLNLPLALHGGSVTDASRLEAIKPTLALLLGAGARVVLCSHLGRPQPATQNLQQMRQHASLAPVAALLQDHLGADVFTGLVPDCIGAAAEAAVAALAPGQVCANWNGGRGADDSDSRLGACGMLCCSSGPAASRWLSQQRDAPPLACMCAGLPA